MKHTNININSDYGPMKYYVEYNDGAYIYKTSINTVYITNRGVNVEDGISDRRNATDIYFLYPESDIHNVIRDHNEWWDIDVSTKPAWTFQHPYSLSVTDEPRIPKKDGGVKMSKMKLYYPRFSVDTYERGIKYALEVFTYINGVKVILGSMLLSRNSCHAVDDIKVFANEEYYEYTEFYIIDPMDLLYGDGWKDFRTNILMVPIDANNISGSEYNDEVASLNVTLHPVIESDELCGHVSTNFGSLIRKEYVEVPGYTGAQNVINMANSHTDYLSLNISDNHMSDIDGPFTVTVDVQYNPAYAHNTNGLKEYLQETYHLGTAEHSYLEFDLEFVIQDENCIYKYVRKRMDNIPTTFSGVSDWGIVNSWDGFKEGMFINAFLLIKTGANALMIEKDKQGVEITPKNMEDLEDMKTEQVIYIRSNKIPLTKELYSYMCHNEEGWPYQIDLKNVQMEIKNINIVNKIEKNVIRVMRPITYKSSVIKPVFFKSQELGHISIHPSISERICINLDRYKGKVNTFIFNVEGVNFIEVGRTSTGVIFNIDGGYLPKSKKVGTYFIMNENSEVITSGKYTYEE